MHQSVGRHVSLSVSAAAVSVKEVCGSPSSASSNGASPLKRSSSGKAAAKAGAVKKVTLHPPHHHCRIKHLKSFSGNLEWLFCVSVVEFAIVP